MSPILDLQRRFHEAGRIRDAFEEDDTQSWDQALYTMAGGSDDDEEDDEES